ncbi:hypothetical protein [Chryseolinea lacunae]|uniref:Uncharacterized protein n=1 Tax=Chryseolinea lacunae TaxID=2801331 RepID=A0ABS1KY96_9BACT|nr:hypothetical protein [Chryseolinea lacunae]MBL0744222.1 hypothetical protein [Chryseolinea lacunae]
MPARVQEKFEINPIKKGLIIALSISLFIGIALVLLVLFALDTLTR